MFVFHINPLVAIFMVLLATDIICRETHNGHNGRCSGNTGLQRELGFLGLGMVSHMDVYG
jgi:hypothetical protein